MFDSDFRFLEMVKEKGGGGGYFDIFYCERKNTNEKIYLIYCDFSV